MLKKKTYHNDDAFKAKARAHQFEYKEAVLKDFYEEKNPQVVLSSIASKQGKIFCDEYRSLICKHFKSFGTTALFSNMLRSEHIPYNVFIPMTTDLAGTTQLFNRIVGGGIAEIKQIHIEFAGCGDRERYLFDYESGC